MYMNIFREAQEALMKSKPTFIGEIIKLVNTDLINEYAEMYSYMKKGIRVYPSKLIHFISTHSACTFFDNYKHYTFLQFKNVNPDITFLTEKFQYEDQFNEFTIILCLMYLFIEDKDFIFLSSKKELYEYLRFKYGKMSEFLLKYMDGYMINDKLTTILPDCCYFNVLLNNKKKPKTDSIKLYEGKYLRLFVSDI